MHPQHRLDQQTAVGDALVIVDDESHARKLVPANGPDRWRTGRLDQRHGGHTWGLHLWRTASDAWRNGVRVTPVMIPKQ